MEKTKVMHRYSFIALLMALVGVLIIVRAAIIMSFERDFWERVANRFHKENLVVKAVRGNIISADGKLMASSLPEYKIYMDFMAAKHKGENASQKKARIKAQAFKDSMLRVKLDSICMGLHAIFPDKSAEEFRRHILHGRKIESRNYLLYPKRISYIQYKEASKLPLFKLNKNTGGFHYQAFNQRKKPFGSLAARTLGQVYAAKDSAVSGLELSFDSLLKGKNGLRHRQKVMSKYLDFVDVPAIDGCDIVTTIDVGMQDIAEKALTDMLKDIDAKSGVALLMEVKTGDVKAIVNMSRCGDGVYREVNSHAIADMLEPGSVFKTVSLMVALEDGYIKTTDGVDTGNGVMMMHGRPMKDHNWNKGGYHYLTVPEILMYSSNIGVSYLIDKYYYNNPDKFVDGVYRTGIQQPLHLQLKGEGKPYIRRPKDGKWSKTALAWMSIGYETQIPPMNVLTFYNAIANQGVMVRPRLVTKAMRGGDVVEEYPVEVINPAICSQKTLKDVQMMLEMVVSKGLAKAAGSEQFLVAGKTGTAQISQGSKGYKSGGTKYLLSFVGYFPADNPQYSCMVAIQKEGGPASSGWSAKVFSRIAERVYAKNLSDNLNHAADSNSVMIPHVKRGDVREAQRVLRGLDISTQTGNGWNEQADQPVWGTAQMGANSVALREEHFLRDFVPNVIGMGAKDAVYLMESKGLRVRLSGVGRVVSQSIPSGQKVVKGQTIGLHLK